MRSIQLDEAVSLFKGQQEGYVAEKLKERSVYFACSLTHESLLFSLIIGYWKKIQILTPKKWGLFGTTYTLHDVIHRLIDLNLTFEDLGRGRVKGGYDPKWFSKFLTLEPEFDYAKMDHLLLMMPNDQERKECPNGVFRLFDGNHRAFVLAYKLIKKELPFKPISAVLMV